MNKLKITLSIILTLIFTGIILFASYTLKNGVMLTVNKNVYINFQINYQICLLTVAFLSLVCTYFLNKENFIVYFSVGDIVAPAQELKILGIKQGDNWLQTGLSLSVIISFVTAIFMYFQLNKSDVDWLLLQNGILWILLFSFTNSFGEEIIYRLGVVSPMKGLLPPNSIFIISAILFGLPHFAGMPNGIIGATMAGVLGFVLAKSMYETNGLFWAWKIHFLQDIIIIGALYLLSFINQ